MEDDLGTFDIHLEEIKGSAVKTNMLKISLMFIKFD